MNKHLLIAAFCLLTFVSNGQETFFNVFDNWNVYQGQAVIPTGNGYYLYTYGGTLAEFNQVGDRLWTKRINTDIGPYTTFAERDQNGKLYFTSNTDYCKIIKADSLGTIISTTNYNYGSTKKMIKLNNGNLTLLCQSGADLALLTIDTAGIEQWHATLAEPGYPIDLIQMPDGKICVLFDIGYVYHLYTFSANGDFIKEMELLNLDPDFFVIRSIIAINNEELFYAGENDNNYWRHHEIGKIDVNSGSVLWRKPIFPDVFYAKLLFAGIKGDTIYLAGTIQLTAFYQKQVLTAAINNEGDLLWMNHQGLRTKYEVINARLCADGGLAITGECSNSTCFFLKTNEEGITETLSMPEKRNASSIKVYPNPAKDFAYVSSPISILNVELIDSQGRTILSVNPESNFSGHISIPVYTLQDGIYFIRITDNNRSVSTHKLVK